MPRKGVSMYMYTYIHEYIHAHTAQNAGAGAATRHVPNAPAVAIAAPEDNDPLQIPSQRPQSPPLPTKDDEQVCLCLAVSVCLYGCW